MKGKNMKNRWINFVDLDGVIVNYDKALLKAFGYEINNSIKQKLIDGEDVCSILGIHWSKAVEQTGNIGHEHWVQMEPYPWTFDLIDSLKKYGEVAFLTSTGRHFSPAAQGKQEWIRQKFNTHNAIIAKEKFYMAKPNALLIDDDEGNRKTPQESNVVNFEKWGGNSFLWPNANKMLYNHIKYEDVKKELIDKIIKIKTDNKYE
jgi:hypothetical protein